MPFETGAANTMVAAVLESAGYYYQQVVLDDLTPAFKGSLGALVFLVGLVVAIFSVAVRGSYKFTAWLLLGPPLFFAAVLPRADIGNAKWEYAKMGRPQGWVDEEVSRVLESGSGSYSVSKLFQRYNELVSETVQEIVKIINKGKTESDRTMILKGQLLSMMMSRQIQNPFLTQLINQGLLGQCADVVNAAKEILDPNLSQEARDVARNTFETMYNVPMNTLSPDAARALLAGASNDQERQLAQLLLKPFSCADIWEETRRLLEKDAKEGVEKVLSIAEANLVSREEILKKLTLAVDSKGRASSSAVNSAAADFDKLVKATMKRSLMIAEERRSFAGMIADVRNRGNDVDTVSLPNEPSLAETEYARGRSTEWAENTRMLTAAGNIPYYQGLLLYFLALAFPFFALLLLVPGKHAGFLLWFILWLWVKSWDIGIAVVVQLDDILFSILSYARELYPTGPQSNTDFEQGFAEAMWMLRQSDPSFQLTTYYNIIATCLLSIPVVLSQFIVGSLTGGAGIVAQGLRASAEAFSSSARASQGQLAVNNLKQDMFTYAAERAARNYERLKSGDSGSVADKIASFGERRNDALRRGLPEDSVRLFEGAAAGRPSAGRGGGSSSQYNNKFSASGPSIPERLDRYARFRSAAGLLEGFTKALPAFNPPDISPNVPGKKQEGGSALPVIDSAFGLVKFGASTAASLLNQIADKEEQMLPKILTAQTEWERYDAMYSVEGRRLASEARLYGMLEVPWTQDSGEFQEMELERMVWGIYQDINRSYFNALADGATQTLSAGRSIFGSDAYKSHGQVKHRESRPPGRGSP